MLILDIIIKKDLILRISKEVKADSKRRGIITNRYTNPLKPNYKYIGNNEIFDCFGDRISNGNSTHKNEKLNKLNISLNNSKLTIYDEFQNQNNNNNSNNKFRYNNSNNLVIVMNFLIILKIKEETEKCSKVLVLMK